MTTKEHNVGDLIATYGSPWPVVDLTMLIIGIIYKVDHEPWLDQVSVDKQVWYHVMWSDGLDTRHGSEIIEEYKQVYENLIKADEKIDDKKAGSTQ